MIPHLATNLANGWKKGKKKNGSLARCRNFEWKMDERRIRAVAAAHPSSFVFMRA